LEQRRWPLRFGLVEATTKEGQTITLLTLTATLLVRNTQESEVLNSSIYYLLYDGTLLAMRIYKCDLDGSCAIAMTDGSSSDHLGVQEM
jgi:hypothetical protein